MIKLKDPTGSISGTLTADVLPAHPQLTKDSVLILEKVSSAFGIDCGKCLAIFKIFNEPEGTLQVVVLRTPPPHAVHHLCIVPANVARVVPPSQEGPTPQGSNWNSAAPPALIGSSIPAQPAGHSQLQQPTQPRVTLPGLAVLAGGAVPLGSMAPRDAPSPAPPMECGRATACGASQPPPRHAVNGDVDDLMAGLDDEFAF